MEPIAAITTKEPRCSNVNLNDMSLQMTKMPHDDSKMPFYAMGTNFALQVSGNNLRRFLKDDELEVVAEAFRRTMKEPMDEAKIRAMLTEYGPRTNEILQGRARDLSVEIKKEGAAYAEEFLKDNEGAIKTDSGLVFFETQTGASDDIMPNVNSTVKVHYHGMLTDGTVVDSSVDRGEPATFPLAEVIAGWREGLCRMTVGTKATLVVPSELAYGEAGNGDAVPPGSTLKFEVELLEIMAEPEMPKIRLVPVPQEGDKEGEPVEMPEVFIRRVDSEEA